MQTETQTKNPKLNIPQVADLFSGCGGLSYGFYMKGFNAFSGVELNQQACSTISYNLHWRNGDNKEHLNKDITDVTVEDLGLYKDKTVITIGGPPCQAYSRIGKSKLKSLGEDRYGLNDKRAFLYKEFIRLALAADSQAIVMENVPESVNFLGINIPQTVCNILEANGYNAIWTILNSADFGVPQTRERIFVMAVKKEVGVIDHLPTPTHKSPGKMKEYKEKYQKFTRQKSFRIPVFPNSNLPLWVSVREAISDLPVLFPNALDPYKANKMSTKMPYQSPPLNDYQKIMRSKYNITYTQNIDGNSFRKTSRDFRIFEKMQPGDDYRRAHEIAVKLFEEARLFHNISINDKQAYQKMRKEYVPPYDTTKFFSKWKKLNPDKPSHTLVAHLGTDTYSHIHPWEPRGISVREAARLQSFPDEFTFNVPMGAAFSQIGNAVPPLLAQGVAEAILRNLNITI
ncbi:DNA cytosine methyltransferase [Gracilibacillus oryzae]|uniref:DNA (cytosine-5-)-methyltransferase n=1 Tax=Gracilibacillus oryzae TaxID=1672701 RepID=A0A7C8KM19_9BACI|nr:DNA cytosine methyltransferase [Gracilibacillus oryzae]